jgi:hypothetical protein
MIRLTPTDRSILAQRALDPLLPSKPRGVARVDDRRVLNGIFWVLRSGDRGAISPSAMDLARPAATGLSDSVEPACGTD